MSIALAGRSRSTYIGGVARCACAVLLACTTSSSTLRGAGAMKRAGRRRHDGQRPATHCDVMTRILWKRHGYEELEQEAVNVMSATDKQRLSTLQGRVAVDCTKPQISR